MVAGYFRNAMDYRNPTKCPEYHELAQSIEGETVKSTPLKEYAEWTRQILQAPEEIQAVQKDIQAGYKKTAGRNMPDDHAEVAARTLLIHNRIAYEKNVGKPKSIEAFVKQTVAERYSGPSSLFQPILGIARRIIRQRVPRQALELPAPAVTHSKGRVI